VTGREELQKQYAEYKRKLDELKKTVAGNTALKMRVGIEGLGTVEIVYSIEDDALEISEYAGDDLEGAVSLSGTDAEKLYHFLGGLYG
jgi:hypothetical protein